MWVRQGDFAVDAALALTDMNDHAFAVEVGWFQMAQFIRAQAGGVEGGEHRPVFEIVGVVENANDFFHAEYAGEGAPAFGPGDSRHRTTSA